MTPPKKPARPAAGTALCNGEDVKDGAAICVDFAEGDARWSVLVARAGGDVVAYENSCPHARLPLERADGAVVVQERRFIVCAMHGASFDMATGTSASSLAGGRRLTAICVHESGGRIVLGDPPA